MRLKVYPKSPAPRHVELILQTLQDGGIIVFPTDTVYSFGCDAKNPDAVKKLAALKGIALEKAKFSFMFADLSLLGDYTKHVSKDAYRMMNRLLPGPFTFILNAHANVSKIIPNKKTIGIRVPDNPLPQILIEKLGNPILTTSVYDDDQILEYTTDPELIASRYEGHVELIVDGGFGHNEASTVVDGTGDEIYVIRKGLGELEEVA